MSADGSAASDATALVIEPFYGGSHRQLTDLLASSFDGVDVYTLPAKKWPWRCRCSALHFSRTVLRNRNYRVLFASSVLNVAEFIALRRDLAYVKKVIYFHENQLVYPVQWWKERDFQYGYNQIVSCMVSDVVLFNSSYNCESFLSAVDRFLGMMPDHRPKGVADEIRPKCRVLYFPIEFPSEVLQSDDINDHVSASVTQEANLKPLHIVWPHRWEHDKDPGSFFEVLFKLLDEDDVPFKLSVLGQAFEDVPPIFEAARKRLGNRIIHWGFCSAKESYFNVLRGADVVVSTSKHEFFGVALLEAVFCGCYPLCPNRLVYPEIFESKYLYNTIVQLQKRLRYFCQKPEFVRKQTVQVDLLRFSWQTLRHDYQQQLELDS